MSTAAPLPDDLTPEIDAYLAGVVVGPDKAPSVADLPAIDPTLGPRIARRRARVAARLRERAASLQAECERLQFWAQQEDARDQREAARLDALLAALLWRERERDPRRKSLSLPYGVTVQARMQPAEWRRDDGALLSWALECAPDFVENRPALRWADMKKAATVTDDGRAVLPDGQPLPGVQVIERGEKITVSVEGGGDGE